MAIFTNFSHWVAIHLSIKRFVWPTWTSPPFLRTIITSAKSFACFLSNLFPVKEWNCIIQIENKITVNWKNVQFQRNQFTVITLNSSGTKFPYHTCSKTLVTQFYISSASKTARWVTNIVDLDQMSHSSASDPVIHCLFGHFYSST